MLGMMPNAHAGPRSACELILHFRGLGKNSLIAMRRDGLVQRVDQGSIRCGRATVPLDSWRSPARDLNPSGCQLLESGGGMARLS